MKKNIVLIIMLVLVVVIGGFTIYNKFFSFENTIQKLTDEEIKDIETFINKSENNAFILMNYSNPEDIFTDKNIFDRTNYAILKYSISSSDFSRSATESEIDFIWDGKEAYVDTRVSTLDDLKSFIKEKTNYDISNDKIEKHLFSEEKELFVYLISDEIFEKHEIVDGYKINNKYHVVLDDNSEVVLTNKNNKYYFYSCNNIYLGQTTDK